MEEGSTLKLIMEKGPREGETLEFKPGSMIRIGRVVRGNTLAVKDAGISSNHLLIESKSGKWVLSDLDSSNGTILNESKLSPTNPLDLNDGDTIKIGEFTSIKVKIGIGDESRLRRNPRRRAAAAKANLGSISENTELGFGLGFYGDLVNKVEENRNRKGRPKKARVLKNELEKVEEFDNVGPNLSSDLVLPKIPASPFFDENGCRESEGLDQIVEDTEDKKNREGRRQKRNLQVKQPLEIENEVLNEEKVLEGLNLGQEGCEGLASTSGAKETGIDVGEGPDLEKTTLGEWFDYLESYLPKQIYDATEEMILSMRLKAEQFHEFMLQQKSEKEKGKLLIR